MWRSLTLRGNPAETVVFTPEQRRAVDEALTGYLADYEAQWQRHEIPDYFLMPGHHRHRAGDTSA